MPRNAPRSASSAAVVPQPEDAPAPRRVRGFRVEGRTVPARAVGQFVGVLPDGNLQREALALRAVEALLAVILSQE
jgi:hypothetical protein